MNKFAFGSLIACAAAAVLTGSAVADTVNGGGGLIPSSGSGGGGVWQTSLPTSPFSSSVVVPVAVASINSVTLSGLSHTWVGDLHAVLVDPNGVGYNIFVRPGFTGTGFGNSGDFLGGTYTFFDPTSGNPGLPTVSPTNPAPGNYSQSYGLWTNGNLGINNTGFNSVSGAAGSWTLRIYDWASGDTGSLQGWTLDYNPVPAPGAVALLGLAGLVGSRRRRA